MAPALSPELGKLLSTVPKGAWVAISSDQQRIVCYGAEMRAVLEEARTLGESDPIIIRIPESAQSLVL